MACQGNCTSCGACSSGSSEPTYTASASTSQSNYMGESSSYDGMTPSYGSSRDVNYS